MFLLILCVKKITLLFTTYICNVYYIFCDDSAIDFVKLNIIPEAVPTLYKIFCKRTILINLFYKNISTNILEYYYSNIVVGLIIL